MSNTYELNYTNICRGHFPELTAIRKALQWGGMWATLEDAEGKIYDIGAPKGDLGYAHTKKPHILLCLAESKSCDHLEVYWPPEAKDI